MESGSFFLESVEDIVRLILLGDWFSETTGDGREYYVIGMDAYHFDKSDIESPERPVKWQGPSPSLDKFLRAQIAASHRSYEQLA